MMMTGHERQYVRIFGSIVVAGMLVQLAVIPVYGLLGAAIMQHAGAHRRPARHRLVRQPEDRARYDAAGGVPYQPRGGLGTTAARPSFRELVHPGFHPFEPAIDVVQRIFTAFSASALALMSRGVQRTGG